MTGALYEAAHRKIAPRHYVHRHNWNPVFAGEKFLTVRRRHNSHSHAYTLHQNRKAYANTHHIQEVNDHYQEHLLLYLNHFSAMHCLLGDQCSKDIFTVKIAQEKMEHLSHKISCAPLIATGSRVEPKVSSIRPASTPSMSFIKTVLKPNY